METRDAPRDSPATRDWTLIGLELLLAVAALAGAVGLITGAMPAGDMANHLPFQSTVFGGLALGAIVAVPAAVVAIAAAQGRSWAREGHLVVGAMLMGWIVVQIGFIGFTSWLQPIMFTWGAAILALGWIHRRSTADPHRAHRADRPRRTGHTTVGQVGDV